MGTTPTYRLRYPELADPADVPTDMHELALDVEAALGGVANAAALPPRLSAGGSALPGNDCNQAVAGGWYYADGSALNRPPIADDFTLLVIPRVSANDLRQFLYWRSTWGVWTRRRTGGVWTAWLQIAPAVGAALGHSIYQTVAAGFDTQRFDSVQWDTSNGYMLSTPNALTIPYTGRWALGFAMAFSGNDTADGTTREAIVFDNHNTRILDAAKPPVVGGPGTWLTQSTVWQFTAGDYISLMTYTDSAGTKTSATAGSSAPKLWAYCVDSF